MLTVTNASGFGAGSAAFLPTDIAGIEIWLRSDLGITKDASDFVSSWADQSGNGRDFTQATNKPLWVDSLVNSHSGVRFDGTNDILMSASTGITMPIHVFTIFNAVSWVINEFVWWAGNTVTTGKDLIMQSSSPNYTSNDSVAQGNTVSLEVGTWGLIHQIFDNAGAFSTSLNDDADVGGSAENSAQEPDNWALGARFNLAWFSNVEIAEFVVYDAAITGADLTNLKTYFNSRYAIW